MKTLSVSRRRFRKGAGVLAGAHLAGATLPCSVLGLPGQARPSADYTLHIKNSPIEIAPSRIISAITCNGQFPGLFSVSRKDGRSPSTSSTTLVFRSSIGTVRRFPSMRTDRPKKALRLFPRMASDGFNSCQRHLVSAFITLIIARVAIWPLDNTAEIEVSQPVETVRPRESRLALSFLVPARPAAR